MIDEKRLSALISKDVSLRLVEPHIYSVYPDGENTNSYDKMGTFYDLVLCNRFYNRLIWGYSIAEYASLTRDALESKNGWVLDAGCGSLAFTAKTYANYSNRPIVLLDQSTKLLRLARARMVRLNGSVPGNMVFLHGNVLDLPFKPKGFRTIVSLNLLHMFEPEDIRRMLLELRNALANKGTISFTTLVKNDRLADRYINMLHKAGELYPRNIAQLLNVFDELSMPVKHQVKGNMAFIYYA